MKVLKKPPPLNQGNLIFLLGLLIVLMFCLTACTTTVSYCPPWPPATKQASKELRDKCGLEQCPAVYEWIGRLYKLRDQLKECE